MRIEPGKNFTTEVTTKKDQKAPTVPAEQVAKQVQNMDLFDYSSRGMTYEDIIDHFQNPPSTSTLPEIIGPANAPKISDEALEKLREQFAIAQLKSNKKA